MVSAQRRFVDRLAPRFQPSRPAVCCPEPNSWLWPCAWLWFWLSLAAIALAVSVVTVVWPSHQVRADGCMVLTPIGTESSVVPSLGMRLASVVKMPSVDTSQPAGAPGPQ